MIAPVRPPTPAPIAAPAPVPMPGITDPATAPAPAPITAPTAVLPIACCVAGSVAQPPSARQLAAVAERSRRVIGASEYGKTPHVASVRRQLLGYPRGKYRFARTGRKMTPTPRN